MSAWQASFFNALSFLTIIKPPARLTADSDFSKALYSFSFVGLVIGAGLALIYFITGAVSPFLMLVYLCLITGFLHIDGLADTFDAFFSGKDKEKMLEIMKDSRIGAMGAAGIVLTLTGKLYAFILIDSAWFLIIIPALSRFAMVILLINMPYVRKKGLGTAFTGAKASAYIQIIPVAILMFFTTGKLELLIIVTAFILVYAALSMWYKAKIGGITGDTTGALCEIMETALFITAAAICSI